jgi:predicted DNA-binding transcriptional regulator AlpA
MDRKTVALTLGCSEKTVSRYVASGRLPDVRKNGALDIDEADVMKLKAQLETPVLTAREVETGRDISAIVAVPKRREVNHSSALAIWDRGAGRTETGRDRPFVPTSDKLLLSLDEAAALTGLSAARLRLAIGEEKLVARKVGRAWKMRRGDVERFVDSIFGEGQ